MAILDEYVVDLALFIARHPGGSFSLDANVGRDISKFFHGGYSLENIKVVPVQTHSSDARKIVNSLIIGRLEGNSQKRLM